MVGAADLGVAWSYQQTEIPAARAERVQHDLHEAQCACGRVHAAARPAGVPDSALSIGPRLRALAVYLVVFQHVPVQRCQQLIADVTGAAVSAGFVHSCLRRAASLAAEVVALIRALITAAAVAGFDETTCSTYRVYQGEPGISALRNAPDRLQVCLSVLDWARRVPVEVHLMNLNSRSYISELGPDAATQILAAERSALLAEFPAGIVRETYRTILVTARS